MLSIIVAKSRNNVIGNNNTMLWKLPDDLKRFKEKTTGHVIIMGRKTFESLGRVLPNRKHIILSRNKNFKVDSEDVKVIHSVDELNEYINDEEEYCKKMYVTQLEKDFYGDAIFPEIDENEWIEVSREQGPQNEIVDFEYEYVTYVRK